MAAILEEQNNRMISVEKSILFLQVCFIVLYLQHGCHESTLLSGTVKLILFFKAHKWC